MEFFENPPQMDQQTADALYNMQQQQQRGTSPVPLSKDEGLQKWLLNFRENVLLEIQKKFLGYEYDANTMTWSDKPTQQALMNEKGVNYIINFLYSYVNPIYMMSNIDGQSNDINYFMRTAMCPFINALFQKKKEFEIKSEDIPVICKDVESKLYFIFNLSKDGRFLEYLQKTHNVSEVITKNPDQRSGGILSNIPFFGKQRQ